MTRVTGTKGIGSRQQRLLSFVLYSFILVLCIKGRIHRPEPRWRVLPDTTTTGSPGRCSKSRGNGSRASPSSFTHTTGDSRTRSVPFRAFRQVIQSQ